ncbi:hypothetical protein B0H94_1114 [Salsuginibacillus halophilus]|uniref:Uncharacterized protein n=1 Tax=Salsuginibacillus halophilus TaxID=517424 RepID=A0A2P8HAD8_9BACI|nr:SA1362 family protein [Salsuginibacillus halophilus]PSL43182.1 hypothetical protein B0H94_1114 [Salsuginibacillus halophilus]
MSKVIRQPLLFLIFGLAILGLGNQLLTNPGGLVISLLIGAAVAVGLYYLLTRVVLKRMAGGPAGGSQPVSKGRGAAPARSSRPAPTKGANVAKAESAKRKPARKRSEAELKVIEGNKNKKKDRAHS